MSKPFSILMLICLFSLTTGCAARNIWEASRNGSYDQVKNLIKDKPSLVHAMQDGQVPGDGRNKWSPLHYAVENNHVKIVRLLLKNGADPLAKARGGWTPLHAARGGSHLKIERMLIKAIKDSGREIP